LSFKNNKPAQVEMAAVSLASLLHTSYLHLPVVSFFPHLVAPVLQEMSSDERFAEEVPSF
jgi:hypothetical protein